jgi:hypothetical protein
MLDKIKLMYYGKPPTITDGILPTNNGSDGVAEAMFLAWKAYVKEYVKEKEAQKAVIVFLIEDIIITPNYFEQLKFMR